MQLMYKTLVSMNMHEYLSFPDIQKGTHTHLLIKRPISMTKLQQTMQKNNILISTSAKNYLHKQQQDHLLQVKVSNVSTEKITSGLTALLRTIKKMSDLNVRQFF